MNRKIQHNPDIGFVHGVAQNGESRGFQFSIVRIA